MDTRHYVWAFLMACRKLNGSSPDLGEEMQIEKKTAPDLAAQLEVGSKIEHVIKGHLFRLAPGPTLEYTDAPAELVATVKAEVDGNLSIVFPVDRRRQISTRCA